MKGSAACRQKKEAGIHMRHCTVTDGDDIAICSTESNHLEATSVLLDEVVIHSTDQSFVLVQDLSLQQRNGPRSH